MACLILQMGRELSLVIKWGGGGNVFFCAYWIQEDCSTAKEVSVFFFLSLSATSYLGHRECRQMLTKTS